mmetsp:Transcript_2804/g.5671  ORF Transcript_2804/g.5671 Transcript_2804/m.5671 type:complete len:314 (-) Transcript_2804:772-1713(-)
MEPGGVPAAVHNRQAVPRRGLRVLELLHQRLQLEGPPLARLVAVVLGPAAVEEAGAEGEPVGGAHRAVGLVHLPGRLLHGQHALGHGVDLLQDHLVVRVRRGPEVVVPREDQTLLHGGEGRLDGQPLVLGDGGRQLRHLQHVVLVVDAPEAESSISALLLPLLHVRRPLFLRALRLLPLLGRLGDVPGGHALARRQRGGGGACLDHQLRELVPLVLPLDAQHPGDLEGKVDGMAGGREDGAEGFEAAVPAEARGELGQHRRADRGGRRGQGRRLLLLALLGLDVVEHPAHVAAGVLLLLHLVLDLPRRPRGGN